jgi:hypothetical protein
MSRLILLLAFAAHAEACVCSGWPSIKQAWQEAPAVFLGTVEKADPDGDPRQTMFQEQSIRIRVDEAFKGVSTGQIIELHEGGSDCAAKFRTGQRAVFYLNRGREPGTWGISPCSHALGSAEPQGDDLLFVHGLPKSATGARLSGQVGFYEEGSEDAFRKIGGAPNISIKISGPGGYERTLTTNADGVYEVYGLPPGKYSVRMEPPKGWKVHFPVTEGSVPVRDDPAAVVLGPEKAASVGFVLKADTRVSGRVLDSKGAPLTGVCIDLEPLAGRGENGGRFFDCSKTAGEFEITMMPPGKYRLLAHDEVRTGPFKSKSTVYYPGVRDREQATIVSVEAGKYIAQLDLKIPSGEKRYRVSGRLQFADGVPVKGATVTFTSAKHGYFDTTDTGPDGLFGLYVIAGMDGRLTAQLAVIEISLKSCPEFQVGPQRKGMFRFMDANPIPLSGDSDHVGLKLQMPSSSCAALNSQNH